MDAELTRSLIVAADLMADAQTVVVLTGAGVSAESGISTFRDAQSGLWSDFDPLQLASPEGFAADPGLVWRWYMHRLIAVEAATPNPGHLALAELERLAPAFTLITQNVDDLHERAGNAHTLHLHGRIGHFFCCECQTPYTLRPDDLTSPMPPVCTRIDSATPWTMAGLTAVRLSMPLWPASASTWMRQVFSKVNMLRKASAIVRPTVSSPWLRRTRKLALPRLARIHI